MIVLDYLIFLVASASVVVAAAVWARRMYPTRPWSRMLAIGVLAVVEVVFVSEVLGTFGLMRRGPMVLAVIIIAATSGLLSRQGADTARVVPVRWPLAPWPTLAVAAVGAGLLAVSLGRPATGLDTLQYHYPLVAHWMDVANLTTPKVFSVGIEPWFYPSNGELLAHWSVVWFHQDFLISLVSWATFGLTGAAVIGLCRRLGVGLVTGLLAALAVLSIPVIWSSQLRSGQVDLLTVAFLLLAVYFGLCWWQSPRLTDAVLAGASAGIAAGAKYVALPSAILLGALFTVVVILAAGRRRIRPATVAKTLAAAGAATLVTGAYFYLRNYWIVGNPLFPGSVAGLPGAWMPLDIDKLNITILDYIVDLYPHPWILTSWLALTWLAGVMAVVGLFAVPLIVWWRRTDLSPVEEQSISAPGELTATQVGASRRSDPGPPPRTAGAGEILVVCWIVPLLLFVSYIVAPTSAGGPMGYPGWFPPNVRYGFPFLAAATVGLVCLAARVAPRLGVWLAAVLVAANALHTGLALVGIIPSAGGLPTTTLVVGLGLGVLATLCAWGVSRLVTRVRLVRERRWTAIWTLAAVAAVSGALAAWMASTDHRYEFFPPEQAVAFSAIRDAEAAQPNGLVVAFSNWPWAWPLYGTHLQNTVLAALDENTAGPGEDQPSPGVGKPFATADQLVAFMREHGVEYFVARDAEPLGSKDELPVSQEDIDRLVDELHVREEVIHPREFQMALSRPDAFTLVAHEGPTYVFRVNP